MEFLQNKEKKKKDKMKVGKNEKFCILDVEQFRTLEMLQQVAINNFNSIGSAQEHLVKSLYKQNQPVCGKYMRESCNISI